MINGGEFVEKGIKQYQEQMQMQKEKWLMKSAKELGHDIVEYQ